MLAGSSPDVGVVGYTLGGGLSLIARKYGLCANAVRAIELVTADGRRVGADRDTEPDLFWALRGGGGGFGIVTAIELELFPITQAYAGVLFSPNRARGDEVLHAWRELTHSAQLPDELTTIGRFLRLPPIADVTEPLRGESFVIVEAYHIGDPVQADELLAPLRALGPVSARSRRSRWRRSVTCTWTPSSPAPAAGDGLMLAELPAQALDRFIEVAGAFADFPLLTVELRRLGGALRRAHPEDGTLSSTIQASYSLFAAGMVPYPDLDAPTRAHVQTVKTALAPWAAEHMYSNFAEDPAVTASGELLGRARL